MSDLTTELENISQDLELTKIVKKGIYINPKEFSTAYDYLIAEMTDTIEGIDHYATRLRTEYVELLNSTIKIKKAFENDDYKLLFDELEKANDIMRSSIVDE